jgi:hypothetical protein
MPRQVFQDQLAELNPVAAKAVHSMLVAGTDPSRAREQSSRVGLSENLEFLTPVSKCCAGTLDCRV